MLKGPVAPTPGQTLPTPYVYQLLRGTSLSSFSFTIKCCLGISICLIIISGFPEPKKAVL